MLLAIFVTRLGHSRCNARICGSGVRSGLYGMTNGNVRVLFVGGLSASSCD